MVAIFQKIRTLRLFQRDNHLETPRQIILWWERRRLLFNLIVGATGILTCTLLLAGEILAEKFFGNGVGAGSPILAVFGVFAYGIMANICYTGGWISELVAKYVWREQAENLGKITFALGVIFSSASYAVARCFLFVVSSVENTVAPIKMNSQKLSTSCTRQILAVVTKTRVLIVGDVLLDQFIWGGVSRVSP